MTDPQQEEHGPPVSRQIWRGHLQQEAEIAGLDAFQAHLQSCVAAGQLLTASLFRWEQRLFLYVESLPAPDGSDTGDPESLSRPLQPALASWPGEGEPRHWVPMTDIFHYHRCLGLEQWRRPAPPERRTGRVMRLRPDMASSYIFLHYQLQEERPGIGDKVGLIALHEDLMFFYGEEPTVVDPPGYEGGLTTQNTPGDWHTLMASHFRPWTPEDEDPQWRSIDCLFAV